MNQPLVEQRLLTAWYVVATPVFAVLDLALDLSWRVAGLEPAGARLAYYAALIVLGLAMRRFPRLANLAAVGESSIAIALVIIGAYRDILGLGGGPEDVHPLGLGWIINLLLCGFIGTWAFRRSVAKLRD